MDFQGQYLGLKKENPAKKLLVLNSFRYYEGRGNNNNNKRVDESFLYRISFFDSIFQESEIVQLPITMIIRKVIYNKLIEGDFQSVI